MITFFIIAYLFYGAWETAFAMTAVTGIINPEKYKGLTQSDWLVAYLILMFTVPVLKLSVLIAKLCFWVVE